MRKLIIMSAAAPLVLLAACGDNDAAEQTTTLPAEEVPPPPTEAAAADGPAIALDDAGDYSGTYSYAADDGTTTSVTINSADNSYEYTAADGTIKSGSYTRLDDGYRLKIDDFYAEPAWFAFSNGQLVRLESDLELGDGVIVTGQRYARADDDAVFSRYPEPGSPVAPEM